MKVERVLSIPMPAPRPTRAAPAMPRDLVVLGAAAPSLTRPPAIRAEPIPDARGIANDLGLRYLELNQAITGAYGSFGRHFQALVDPGFQGASDTMPNWFAIAAFASRAAGTGLRAAEAAKEVLAEPGDALPTARRLQRILPDQKPLANALGSAIDGAFGGIEERLAAAVLVATFLVSGADMSDLLDPRFMAIEVGRLVGLLRSAPQGGPIDRLHAVIDTMRNALEDGNRRIFADIGAAGQDYLQWRRRLGRRPRPAEVLRDFRVGTRSDADQSREIYDFALRAVRGGRKLPTDLGRRFPAPRYRSESMLVAGFALYEQAGRTRSQAMRDRMVLMANILLAWREQFEAVQPAFTPPAVKPGEVERGRVFELLTPQIGVPLRFGTWSYRDFVEEKLPDRDGSRWTPRITERNWATFEDRWAGILDAFAQVRRHAGEMWPMPHPDPARPLDP